MASAPVPVPTTPPTTISPDQPVPAEFDLLCEHCGYSLIGLMVERCPECGESFDATLLPLARVPWLYRRRLGRVSAYVQTLKLALFSPRAFAAELCRPVRISGQDAHWFRMLTILVGATGATVGVGGFLQYVVGFWPPREMTAFLLLSCLCVWVAMIVFLRLATDLPTFIWHGLPGRGDDLSPLHQYAAAPLVLLLPAAVVFVGLVYAFGRLIVGIDEFTMAGTAVLFALGLAQLLWSWFTALIFMRTATRCSWGRVALLGAYLPVHWLIMLFLVAMVAGTIAHYGNDVLW